MALPSEFIIAGMNWVRNGWRWTGSAKGRVTREISDAPIKR